MLSIGKLLAENKDLEELYLSWNKICGIGAQAIVETLGDHPYLRALDLPWNSLASCENQAVIHGLGESLASNTALMHLDISNNQLDHVNMDLFGKCLAGNHTLIGLHVPGCQTHAGR